MLQQMHTSVDIYLKLDIKRFMSLYGVIELARPLRLQELSILFSNLPAEKQAMEWK